MKIIVPGPALKAHAEFLAEVMQEPPWLITRDPEELAVKLSLLRLEGGEVLAAIKNLDIAGVTAGLPISREALYELSGTKFGGFFDKMRNPAFYIAKMAVSPKYRQQGVGRMLMTALLDHAIGQGFDRFVLRAHVNAEAARGLYTSFGFSETNIHDCCFPDRTYWVKILR